MASMRRIDAYVSRIWTLCDSCQRILSIQTTLTTQRRCPYHEVRLDESPIPEVLGRPSTGRISLCLSARAAWPVLQSLKSPPASLDLRRGTPGVAPGSLIFSSPVRPHLRTVRNFSCLLLLWGAALQSRQSRSCAATQPYSICTDSCKEAHLPEGSPAGAQSSFSFFLVISCSLLSWCSAPLAMGALAPSRCFRAQPPASPRLSPPARLHLILSRSLSFAAASQHPGPHVMLGWPVLRTRLAGLGGLLANLL
jgi:hypothetical protein